MIKSKIILHLLSLTIISIIGAIPIDIANAVRVIIHPDDVALHQYAGSPVRLNLLIAEYDDQTEAIHQNPEEIPWVFDLNNVPVNANIQTLDIDSISSANRAQAIFSGPFPIPQTTFMLLNHGFLNSLTPFESTHIKIDEEVS